MSTLNLYNVFYRIFFQIFYNLTNISIFYEQSMFKYPDVWQKDTDLSLLKGPE